MRKVILLLCLWMMTNLASAQQRYAVVISEFMADPSPAVGLPPYEWVELTNRSADPVDLTSWRLMTTGGESGRFAEVSLAPDSFLIICSGGALNSMQSYGRSIAIPAFPSLSNDKGLIWLEDATGNIIHAVEYDLRSYKSEIKQLGGWSLEMIDPAKPCLGAVNWSASVAPQGGTPGTSNSISAPVKQPPFQLLNVHAQDSMHIVAKFSETIDSGSGVQAINYELKGGPLIRNAGLTAPLFKDAIVELETPLIPGTMYEFKAAHVFSCTGSEVAENDLSVGLAAQAGSNDIVINEILVNPRPNAFDFVELFNRSSKIIDASMLVLSLRDAGGLLQSVIRLSDSSFPILPAAYVVVTKDLASLQRNYHVLRPENVIEAPLPRYPEDAGDLVLCTAGGTVIDEVKYSRSWQFPLLADAEGVSLERLNADGGSSDALNWHSAASGAGFGTPGYANSQSRRVDNVNDFSVDPAVFSPDNDGHDDIVTVSYRLEESMMGTIIIFDMSGRPVRILANNQLLGTTGDCVWDGIDDHGLQLSTGIYIAYCQLFTLDGRQRSFRKPVVLARSFN